MIEDSFFVVACDKVGMRLDVFLTEQMNDVSRSMVQKWIETGLVLVDKKPVKANYKLQFLQEVCVAPIQVQSLCIKPENISIKIFYEDDDMIVVNKPKGMVVHPATSHTSGTLVNALMFHCKDSLSGIGGVMRPGIVHRIDKDTSGLLMVAKNDYAHAHLSAQLAQHTTKRTYNAVVMNGFSQDNGTIKKPIGRHPKDRKKMAVVPNGREATTHYKVLERLGNYTWIEAQLETGRTHQIRVHMAFIGHPLLGDCVYGNPKQPFSHLCGEGQVLHAKTLGFVHPRTNEYMEFVAPLPAYFENVLQHLRK